MCLDTRTHTHTYTPKHIHTHTPKNTHMQKPTHTHTPKNAHMFVCAHSLKFTSMERNIVLVRPIAKGTLKGVRGISTLYCTVKTGMWKWVLREFWNVDMVWTSASSPSKHICTNSDTRTQKIPSYKNKLEILQRTVPHWFKVRVQNSKDAQGLSSDRHTPPTLIHGARTATEASFSSFNSLPIKNLIPNKSHLPPANFSAWPASSPQCYGTN